MKRKVNVIEDLEGKKIVIIHDILFGGKRTVNWENVKQYLQKYVGEVYKIEDTNDEIYIGQELPDEYAGSKYTYKLKGANAKAKANATQGIQELIEIATCKRFRENKGKKHKSNAKYGWYLYDARFALPVFSDDGEVERYNVFHAGLLVRHAADGKMYLYDIMEIKKETSNLFGS